MTLFLSQGSLRRNGAPTLRVRLDSHIVVLRGAKNEAVGQCLRGVVELRPWKILPVIAVHVKVTGRVRIGWREEFSTPDGLVVRDVDRTTEVFSYLVPPLLCGPHFQSKSSSGGSSSQSYEWPFEIPIPGDLPESVEGLPKSNITYELEAKAVRGSFIPDSRIAERLHIIRLRASCPSETEGDSIAEGDWMGVLNYRMSVLQSRVMLGSAIPICIRWRTRTDIDVSYISFRLSEIYELRLSAKTHHICKEVARWSAHILEGKRKALRDVEKETNTVSRSLILPRSLRDCTQDVEEDGLKVRHTLCVTVHVRKSDNRSDKFSTMIPIVLLVPFTAAICSTQDIGNTELSRALSDSADLDGDWEAPPSYDELVFDQCV